MARVSRIRHSYRALGDDAVIGVFGDRKRFKPWGVSGGASGSGQNVFINRGREDERELGMSATDAPVKHGDIVEVWSSGGGGYGDPVERDPELVLRDVRLGFVSAAAAREIYRVAVECQDELSWTWTIDQLQTRGLRSSHLEPELEQGE